MDDAIAFFENLLDENTWKRVAMVIVGGLLILFSLTRWQLSDRAFAIGKAAGAL